MEVKHRNPPKTTASPRVKLPSNRQTSAPTESQNSKPTPIIVYKEDEYTPPSMEEDPIQGGTSSYNTRHQKCLWNVQNQVKDTPHFVANFLQENFTINGQPVTQHDYLTKVDNAIIDEEIGVAMKYR